MVNGGNTNHEAVNCEQVWHEVSNYIDGDVNAALRVSMDEHFRTCKRCASVLAGTRNVVQLYGDERMLEVPAGFSQRLEKRLRQPSERKWSAGRWSSWSTWLVPVAAIALFTGALALVDQLTFRPPAKSILAEPGHDVPPDMLVVVSSGAKLFHVPGCKYIHDKESERTMTAKEAMREGYTPCPRCLRQYLKTGLIRESDRDASAEAEERQEEVIGAAGRQKLLELRNK
jgi:hypothetical protein